MDESPMKIKPELIQNGIFLLVLIALNLGMFFGEFIFIAILFDLLFVAFIILKILLWLLERYKQKFSIPFYTAIILGSVGIYYIYKTDQTRFYLEHLPQEMGVTEITYIKNKAWGIGPGGNETGTIAYTLPKNAANQIKNLGISYFFTLSRDDTPRNKYIRECTKWHESPLLTDSNASWRLNSFLDRYGFGIPVDSKISEQINQGLSKKGAYFTTCMGGTILIVIPERQKVFMVYAG